MLSTLALLGILIIPALTWDFTPHKLRGNEQEIRNLVERLLGKQEASRFYIQILDETKGVSQEWFNVTRRSRNDPVQIKGSSAVAVASGFHHYLKNDLHCHVSWDGDQLELPPYEDMPIVEYEHVIADRFRYNMNVCTFSYSYVWWNWTRWEREIDWMALHGFNLVLAFTGTEAVWNQVYLDLGLTQEEIDDHFSGPAFLAWNRMGNIRGGAKLSKSWHETQVNLQRRILKRLRDLGITPVLPAFAGHLPRAITRVFPDAEITYARRWNNFPDKYCCPALLSPSDPLFVKIGSMFVEKLTEFFGTSHVYNCDPFNEMVPNITDVQVIRGYGKAIYMSMTAADPKALWILQGWFLESPYWTTDRAKAFITAVPIGKMVVLDLQAELRPQYKRLENFFGQPFIWCMLHNFGGTLGLQGALQRVYQGIKETRRVDQMVGVGLTMEGIDTNYVVYDFFTELILRVNLDFDDFISRFAEDYPRSRYGEENAEATTAWQILLMSVYNYTGTESLHGQYIFNNRPTLKKQAKYWYKPADIYRAWDAILNAAQQMKNVNNMLQVDVIDLTRQGIQLALDEIYNDIIAAYRQKDLKTIKEQSSKFLTLLANMDDILRCNKKFMLGPWLESAKSLAATPLEEKVYERDARNQISLWGPNGEIRDYANKQWSGVVSNYFAPRWSLFFKYLKQSARSGSSFDSKYWKEVADIEQHFATAYGIYPIVPEGNPILISREIYNSIIQRNTETSRSGSTLSQRASFVRYP